MVRAHGLSRVVSGARWRRSHRLGTGAAAAVLAGAGLVAVSGGAADAAILRVCPQGCAYRQIQPAVDAASAGDTILVGPGSYSGGIVIAKALTLSGAGAGATVICGGGPVVSVSASPVTIRAVTVTGGHAPANGGGILNTGTLTVEDVSLRHNAAGGDGGGMANVGRTATARITSSTISRNTAALEGGGIANEFRAALTLTSDAVSANSADGGGGIGDFGFAVATLSGTTVDRNTAASGGGVISVDEGGALMMTNGEILANRTPGFGGGVAIEGVFRHEQSSATITDTSINGNDPQAQLTLGDTSVTHNTSAGDGGGISNVAAATLTNDSVDANSAAGNGGGVLNGSGQIALIHLYGTMTLDPNTSVSRNHAARGGGIDVAAGTVAVNGATVAGNLPDNCQPAGC